MSGESSETRLARARAALGAVHQKVGVDRVPEEAPALPLAQVLTGLLPGGLRRGQVISVAGSTSLMLALSSAASSQGSWMAIVGLPRVGVVAAARRGIELSRLALMPHPGVQASQVVGACVDGMDVVMLGPRLALSHADRRRLASRARERGSVIIAAEQWDGANVTLAVEDSHWRGLGSGDGRLREREMTVLVAGRSQGSGRRVAVTLDVDPGVSWSRPGARTVVDEEVA
jgi:hypothetical protein